MLQKDQTNAMVQASAQQVDPATVAAVLDAADTSTTTRSLHRAQAPIACKLLQ